jgi:ribosomal protein L4
MVTLHSCLVTVYCCCCCPTDKKTLLILAAANESIHRAGRNVAKLAINSADAIKVFDVLNADVIVMEKGALAAVSAAYGAAAAGAAADA